MRHIRAQSACTSSPTFWRAAVKVWRDPVAGVITGDVVPGMRLVSDWHITRRSSDLSHAETELDPVASILRGCTPVIVLN